MARLTTVGVRNEYLKFSAAHFTIFNATDRERLHGHNYAVSADFVAEVGDNGMCFSYKIFKDKINAICEELDEYTLIAARSPHLKIDEQGEYHRIKYDQDTMLLLKSDTILMPLVNTTVEEFSSYFLDRLVNDPELTSSGEVKAITVRVASGGQFGATDWKAAS